MTSLPSNSAFSGKVQGLRLTAELGALLDAGQHLEARGDRLVVQILVVGIEIGVRRQLPRDRGSAETTGKGRRQLVGPVADQIVEAVVPEAQYLQRQRPMCRLVPQQLAGQIEDAVNVVVVDVADHQHIDVQRLVRREPARGADRSDARLQFRGVDPSGATIDHDQARLLRCSRYAEGSSRPWPRAVDPC